jgi:shikimate dehydrogenase
LNTADNGLPAVYGVLGYPASHSLSPSIHRAAFERLGLRAEYRIFEVPPHELAGFVKSAARQNVHGLNVTIPYKEQIVSLLDYLNEDISNLYGSP